MEFVLKEVTDIVREIGGLNRTLETSFKRPLVNTSENVRSFIQETEQIFTAIIEKARTAQEIMKTKLSYYCNILEIHGRQTIPSSIKDEPNSSPQKTRGAVPVFTVKLPVNPPDNRSEQWTSREPNLSPNSQLPLREPSNFGSDTIGNTSQLTRLPLEGGRDIFGNNRKTDNVKQTSMNDGNGMTAGGNRQYYEMENTPVYGNIASGGSFLTSTPRTLMPSLGELDLQDLPTAQTQDIAVLQGVPETGDDSCLMEWILNLHSTADVGVNDQVRRLLNDLCQEFMECMQRGIQHLNVFELGQPGFDFPDITSFIDDIDTEVDRVGTQSLPVRGKGPDTILCLDTSSSMCGENFNKMITAVHKLIDGIEELANYEEVQENIAVTTFGSYSRVVTHLTNDYTHVKNEIDFLTASGPSSLHRGLSMSLAACIANYAEVSVNDVRLMARVIVITDGMFSTQHGVSDDEFDPMNTIMVPFAAKLFKMNGFVCYCVQIGSSEDTEMLQLLTKTTNGKIFPYEQMGDLAILSKHLFAATRLLHQSPALVDGDEETRENGEATLQALLDLESSSRGAFGREFSDSEKETIIELAMDISKRRSTRIAEPNEYPVQELGLQLPPLGTRVRRGPDWIPTENQDSNGPGTVVNHNNNGTVDVLWDCGVMPCTYHCYDPCQVLTTDRDERQVRAGELIQVGCKVTRGTGWNSGDDDGGPDAWGVVCMCTRKGTVTVRWQSRKIGKYKYGDEVELMDTSVGQAQATGFDVNTGPEFETDSKPTSGIKKKRLLSIVYDTGTRDSNAQFLKSTTFNYHVKSGILDYAPDNHPKPVRCQPFQKPPGIEIPVVWSYQEEGQDKWIEFSADNARKLETDWLNKRKSSLVSILDKGEGRTGEPTHGRIESRVVFAKMTMSSISVGERKSQLTLKVKREEKLNQERRNEQEMSEAGPDKP